MRAKAKETRELRTTLVLVRLACAVSLAVALLLTSGAARAQELSDIPGAFVDVGIGADAAGMGGAVAASIGGASALFWNPAGLASGEHDRAFLLTHCNQMGLVPYSAGAARFQLGDYALAAGLLYSGDSVLSETTLLVAAARALPRMPWAPEREARIGVSIRTRRASFGNNESEGLKVSGTAFGLGLDAGVMLPLTEKITLGVSGRDVVNVLNWDSSSGGKYEENVPATLVLGVAMSPDGNLLLEVDLDKSLHVDNADVIRAGARMTLLDVAVVRAGYSSAIPDGEPEEYSLGAGARVPAGSTTVTVDLAYLFGRLDNTLRLSLGLEM